MRPSRIQVSSMATGQVSGREPRPISTSRQPVLPLMVSSRPPPFCDRRRRISRSSRFRPRSAPGRNRGRRFPSGAGRRRSRSPRMALSRRPRRSLSSVPAWRAARRRRSPPSGPAVGHGAADAGEHGRYVAVARVERFAELAIAPANPREPALQRGDGRSRVRVRAVDAGGEIEADGLRVGGSAAKPWRRSQEENCRQSAS